MAASQAAIPTIVVTNPSSVDATEATGHSLAATPKKRFRRKKSSDPFVDLPDSASHNSPDVSPSRGAENESLFKRVRRPVPFAQPDGSRS